MRLCRRWSKLVIRQDHDPQLEDQKNAEWKLFTSLFRKKNRRIFFYAILDELETVKASLIAGCWVFAYPKLDKLISFLLPNQKLTNNSILRIWSDLSWYGRVVAQMSLSKPGKNTLIRCDAEIFPPFGTRRVTWQSRTRSDIWSASKSVYYYILRFLNTPASSCSFLKTVSFPVDTSELYKCGDPIIT